MKSGREFVVDLSREVRGFIRNRLRLCDEILQLRFSKLMYHLLMLDNFQLLAPCFKCMCLLMHTPQYDLYSQTHTISDRPRPIHITNLVRLIGGSAAPLPCGSICISLD